MVPELIFICRQMRQIRPGEVNSINTRATVRHDFVLILFLTQGRGNNF